VKNIIILFYVVMFCSCNIYKYQFKEDLMQIVSKKRNPINSITIESESGRRLAKFWAIHNTWSREFSLKTFSPEYFECAGNCPFKFDTGKVYFLSMTPKGDGAGKTINIMLQSDGRIIEKPLAVQGWLINPLLKDSAAQRQK
jgi:hypothetical protein